jgi:ubiquitin-activating enzyme E1
MRSKLKDMHDWYAGIYECAVKDKNNILSFLQFSPLHSIFGGFASHEIVKALTLYDDAPGAQWLYWDFSEDMKIPLSNDLEVYLANTKSCFELIEERIRLQRVFIVGAGAIGCEVAKHVHLWQMGSDHGMVHVTDNDVIEISNLNRQFLYTMNNVKSAKSIVLTKALLDMNPKLNIKSYQSFVGDEYEKLFGFEFWKSLTLVLSAVDNVLARSYLSQKCIAHSIPFLDTGTSGPIGYSDQYIPFQTGVYVPVQIAKVESCTITSFPKEPEHVAQWARKELNCLLHTTSSPLEKESCTLARECFTRLFNSNIIDLLEMTDEEQWISFPRPIPIVLDSENSTHSDFVNSASRIMERVAKSQVAFDK